MRSGCTLLLESVKGNVLVEAPSRHRQDGRLTLRAIGARPMGVTKTESLFAEVGDSKWCVLRLMALLLPQRLE